MSNIWKFLLGFAFLGTCWTGGKFAFDTYKYLEFDSAAKAQVVNWEILSINEDKYAVQVNYAFDSSKGKQYGSYIFKNPYFHNPYAAEKNLEYWKDLSWTVWYKKSNPSISSLQKLFPFKGAIHATLSLCICLYFTFLFGYSKRLHEQ